MRRITRTAVMLLIGAAPAAPASTLEMIYDVSFEAPTHVAGQAPTVGAGDIPRGTVSRVSTDPPLVYHGPHPILRDALIFDTYDLARQETWLSFAGVDSYDAYVCDASVVVSTLGSVGSASIQLHGDDQFNLTFNAGGLIYLDAGGLGRSVDASWRPDVPLRVGIRYNIREDTVSFVVDDVVVWTREGVSISLPTKLAIRGSDRALFAIERVRIRGEMSDTPGERMTWSEVKRLFED